MKAHALSSLLAASLLNAAPSHAEGGGTVTVRTASLSGGGIPLQIELRVDDDQVIPIAAPVTGFSAQIEVPRMETWQFGHLEAGADGIGRKFRELGRVSPPEGNALWLLFYERDTEDAEQAPEEESEEGPDGEPAPAMEVDPGADDPEGGEKVPEVEDDLPFEIHAICVDESKLADRGIVLLNLADSTTEIELAGESVEVASHSTGVIQPPAEGSFPVKLFVDFHGHRRPFVTTRWAITEGRRRLAAVVQPAKAPLPRLLTIDEVAPE